MLETAKRLGYEDLDLDAAPSGEDIGQIPNLIIKSRVAEAVFPVAGPLQKVVSSEVSKLSDLCRHGSSDVLRYVGECLLPCLA